MPAYLSNGRCRRIDRTTLVSLGVPAQKSIALGHSGGWLRSRHEPSHPRGPHALCRKKSKFVSRQRRANHPVRNAALQSSQRRVTAVSASGVGFASRSAAVLSAKRVQSWPAAFFIYIEVLTEPHGAGRRRSAYCDSRRIGARGKHDAAPRAVQPRVDAAWTRCAMTRPGGCLCPRSCLAGFA